MGQFKVCHTAVSCNITQEKVTLDDKGGSASQNMLHTQFITPSLSLFYFRDGTVSDHKWKMGSSKHLTSVHWWEKELWVRTAAVRTHCCYALGSNLGSASPTDWAPIVHQWTHVLSHTHVTYVISSINLCQYIHNWNKFLFLLSRVEERLVKQYEFSIHLTMLALASRATFAARLSAVTMRIVGIMALGCALHV